MNLYRGSIILALKGIVNENIISVLKALDDPKRESNLIANIDAPRETGNERDGKTEYMQEAIFAPNPFTTHTIVYFYWFGKSKKNLRWEISLLSGGGSDGVQTSLYDALNETFRYCLRNSIV